MVDILTQLDMASPIINAALGIALLVGGIVWVRKFYKTYKKDMAEHDQKIKEEERKRGEKNAEHDAFEERITAVESAIEIIEDSLEHNRSDIEKLLESDQLAIKTWILEEHRYWMSKGHIDYLALETINARFSVYQDEGGNGWVHTLVKELNCLPKVEKHPLNK